MAALPVRPGAPLGEPAHPARQPDLEEPREIAGEQRQQRGHEDEEGGMLKLQAPADREPGGPERDERGG
jgi:hypothetical protein